MKSLQIFIIVYYIFLENLPPVFSNMSNFRAINGNNETYQINGNDPENKGLFYSIVGSTHDEFSMSNSGLLKFRSTGIGEYSLIIRATDMCGAFTDQKLLIESLQCPCEGYNGGYCKWSNGNSTANDKYIDCICPTGCSGFQ